MCLLWCERDKLRGHQVADGADVLFVFDSSEDAVVEFRDVGAGEGGVERGIEGFIGALFTVSCLSRGLNYPEDCTDLPQLKTVVNLVLEWAHLDLADEFRLDMSVTKDSREQFVKMRKNNAYLVVNCRVEGRQGQTVVAQITVAEHVDQQRHDQRSQNVTVGIARVRQSVAESGNDNSTDRRVLIREIFLDYG